MTNPGSTRIVAEAPSPQPGPAANTKHDHRHNGEPGINPSSREPSINPTMRRPSTPKNNNRPTPGRGWAPQDENGRCPVPGGAEGLFLAGNIVPGAHRRARKAKRICPSLPGVANAVAAYEVHAAAGGGWRAVLGMRPGDAATQDAIKREYRRLSLLVHPDKARCAAADGAFKLLRQACDDALSGRDSRGTGRPRYTAPRRPPAPEPAPPPPPPPPQHMYTQQPQEVILIYCPSCKNEYKGKVGRLEQQAGMKCARCPQWLNPPWQKKPTVKKAPPAGPGRQVFRCPAKCPQCGEQYTSMVCVGRWCLRCKACTKATMVNVQGPNKATATSRRRAGT